MRTFFGNFFRILLVAVSISEWGVLWWLLQRPLATLPLAGHVLGVLVIWAVNRALAARTQRMQRSRSPVGGLPRLYYAVAFTCLFCFSFLVVTGALWVTVKVCLGAIAVEASTMPGGGMLANGVDTGFRWLANAGVGGIVVAFAYGYTFGQRRIRITRLPLPLRHAPASLQGLQIAQISDLHIGQNLDREQLAGFVTRVNALQPDLICITGDIADGPGSDLATFFPVLARLHATYGVIAILGNHDHYAHVDRVEEQLRALTPFIVLRDAWTTIRTAGGPLHVVGLDDRGPDWARGVTEAPYLNGALGTIPIGEPILLLSHRPDVFPQAAAGGVSLTLSGHTHGGQIGLPWFGGRTRNLAEFITPFDRGLYERHGSYLYVNCGLGVTAQRMRLCTPREITLIEVAPGALTQRAA